MNQKTEIGTRMSEVSNLAGQGLDGLIIWRYQELKRMGIPEPFLRRSIVDALLNSAIRLRESGFIRQAETKERDALRLDLVDETGKKSLGRQLNGIYPSVFRIRQ